SPERPPPSGARVTDRITDASRARLKLSLDLPRAGKPPPHFCRNRCDEFRRVACNSYWRRKIAQRALRDDLVTRPAEKQADRQLVVAVTKLIVHGKQIKVRLADVLGHE